jgi:lipoprotein-releasing system permease protein
MEAPVLLGISPERAASVSKIPEHTPLGKFDLGDGKIVIGIDLASKLGLAVGDHIFVHSPLSVMRKDEFYLPEELEISGIFNLGMRDFDGGFVLTSIDVARDLMDMDYGAYSVYVMTDDPFQFLKYADEVRNAIGPGYIVRSWQEVDRVLFEALAHEKSMMFILLAFITVVAIFCVTVTLIVIVVQKTSEIGLLKALGVPTWKILLAFLIHGWVQCLIGTISGVIAGLTILINLPHLVNLMARFGVEVFPKEIYGLSEIPWDASAGDIAKVCLLVLVACTLSCAIPVIRAALLEPVEAFRQD